MRKFDGKTLVLATHNQGKVREISALLEPYGVSCVSAAALRLDEPEETGGSFADNAILKALAAAKASGEIALADDSGLAVNALDGAPGIYSARWAGPEKDFGMAMQTVQDRLGESEDRSAAFVCVLALGWPDGHAEVVQGRCDGQIVWPPRGEKGFGYDPVFVPDGFDRSFAEMTQQEKQRISHRARAFAELVKTCFEEV
ncbi:MAG: RdgB/HAM1 family non-canonical purine NTP pyrophosphatase [Rhodospirillales bacterium]|nr:RdgB/HAM1 family non-canonical purine NTP pyrophosphatase [Rhodospirillales bacterium]MCB9995191.1 RdgB/HAM1 family non-canonical purine NTP pyrophosphatase [Rhodospirillales bacterium]